MPPLSFLRLAASVPAWFAVAVLVAPASAARPTVEEALNVEPRQQGVDFDRPTGDALASASISQEKLDGVSALVVRDGNGGILRAFADSNGDRVVDRWSFFKDGVEVYREFDGPDEDAKADQSRWLNGGGTRWGIDRDGDGVLDAWKVISAQETTAEIVRALAERDAAAFERLLPTKDELAAAGFTGEKLENLTARTTAARGGFARLAGSQKRIGPEASWTSMLTPQPPGTIPAGTPGITRDVTAYDNVVALADEGNRGVQVVVGSLVRCGDAWRPIDAPQLVGEDGRLAEMSGFFTPAATGLDATAGGADDEKLRPLLASLRELEAEMAAADPAGRRRLAARSVAKLQEIVATAAAGERGFWTRQLVETVSAYVQEGLLPDGLATLEQLGESAADDPELAAFIDFRLIQARYAASMESADADPQQLQDEWFESLTTFVERHPQAPEAAEAILQLAFRDEFEGRDEEAVARYGAIAKDFPDTPQARKATGAVRRLGSAGKPLPLAGATVDGRQVSLKSLAGRPVLIHFWSTDCEPCKVDLARIRELHEKYAPRQFGCVGVSVDVDRDRLVAFLREKPLPWPQLYGEGGLESPLAEQFGIMALPTMILVDAEGNVVDRNVSITELERKLAALLSGKEAR